MARGTQSNVPTGPTKRNTKRLRCNLDGNEGVRPGSVSGQRIGQLNRRATAKVHAQRVGRTAAVATNMELDTEPERLDKVEERNGCRTEPQAIGSPGGAGLREHNQLELSPTGEEPQIEGNITRLPYSVNQLSVSDQSSRSSKTLNKTLLKEVQELFGVNPVEMNVAVRDAHGRVHVLSSGCPQPDFGYTYLSRAMTSTQPMVHSSGYPLAAEPAQGSLAAVETQLVPEKIPSSKPKGRRRSSSSTDLPMEGESRRRKQARLDTTVATKTVDAKASVITDEGEAEAEMFLNRTRSNGVPVMSIRIGDETAVIAFYREGFECIQQMAVKMILKEWIKATEPKKQTNFPYISTKKFGKNGKVPPWWPEQVKHMEPDHLCKKDRNELALHILRNMRAEEIRQPSWVDWLKKSTSSKTFTFEGDKGNMDKAAQREKILGQIYTLAGREEEYLNGDIDGDTTVHLDVLPSSLPRIPPRRRRKESQPKPNEEPVETERVKIQEDTISNPRTPSVASVEQEGRHRSPSPPPQQPDTGFFVNQDENIAPITQFPAESMPWAGEGFEADSKYEPDSITEPLTATSSFMSFVEPPTWTYTSPAPTSMQGLYYAPPTATAETIGMEDSAAANPMAPEMCYANSNAEAPGFVFSQPTGWEYGNYVSCGGIVGGSASYYS
ncbi:hypothetical protein P152DRAFT_323137 [Eremomyces bilateralis CBS 781.70]|uniref:Subtelomeric hrmA-associated cluster protein AFUB-079030/YDR124W-like helical bundle domain-containing protein n=1 Tax=Eremomyces bilateralis CBS 781.70 TaxID=1392243 RepID=A0A6G1G628_9PEZI|nr:uncharacterized protein P152DRAFT_323137 [Eremomyces bilateralis CBS 781.70]KAF1813527.1 hypothetical protein P152DRAFT_323137 [Eremomyces bilateralis CBS 781.70]